jgi:hypothetical protein
MSALSASAAIDAVSLDVLAISGNNERQAEPTGEGDESEEREVNEQGTTSTSTAAKKKKKKKTKKKVSLSLFYERLGGFTRPILISRQ